jgi:hypothetical protein
MKKPRKPKASDTPSTDAIAMMNPGLPVAMVPASFARDLERDCSHWKKAAIEWMHSWKEIHARITQAEVQRDEALEKLNSHAPDGHNATNWQFFTVRHERDQWRECAEELVAACTLHYGGDDSEDREKSAEPFLRIMRVVERINSLGKQSTETPPAL